MHCVQNDRPVEIHTAFAGIPLTVAFADGEAIAAVREGVVRALPLVPPFHLSDEDAYLVLPEDIGMEIVDILRDGDLDLLGEAMRDGLLVAGDVARGAKGGVELRVAEAITPRDALARGLPYAETVALDESAVEELNALDHVQVTVASSLVDDDGLEEMLGAREWAGTSWRVPASVPAHLRGAEPTYAWSRRLGADRVGIELAIFVEYEEIVCLLRPALLAR